MAEKRRHPRTPVSLDVSFELEGKTLEARSRDLSVGGMFLFSEKKPPFGTKLELKVRFGGSFGVLSLPSVVRWRDDEGFGVQFGLLGARETFAIAQTIRQATEKRAN